MDDQKYVLEDEHALSSFLRDEINRIVRRDTIDYAEFGMVVSHIEERVGHLDHHIHRWKERTLDVTEVIETIMEYAYDIMN